MGWGGEGEGRGGGRVGRGWGWVGVRCADRPTDRPTERLTDRPIFFFTNKNDGGWGARMMGERERLENYLNSTKVTDQIGIKCAILHHKVTD